MAYVLRRLTYRIDRLSEEHVRLRIHLLELRRDVTDLPARRDHPDGAAARDLARLEAGAGGFREAARWPTGYMHDRLYTWLDPGLSPVLGTVGFRVYVRDRR